jgi:hypothetical protein
MVSHYIKRISLYYCIPAGVATLLSESLNIKLLLSG